MIETSRLFTSTFKLVCYVIANAILSFTFSPNLNVICLTFYWFLLHHLVSRQKKFIWVISLRQQFRYLLPISAEFHISINTRYKINEWLISYGGNIKVVIVVEYTWNWEICCVQCCFARLHTRTKMQCSYYSNRYHVTSTCMIEQLWYSFVRRISRKEFVTYQTVL